MIHPPAEGKRSALRTALVTTLLICALSSGAWAASDTLAQGFEASDSQGKIVPGALVSLASGNSRQVELATTSSADRLTGVVDSRPLLAISNDAHDTQVVISGTTSVLVSDINGKIAVGDKITVSPVAGVGMRATSDSRIAGTAQASLDIATSQTRGIIDRNGHSHNVHIGLIPLQVGVATYQAPGNDFLPPFVQNLANTLAGRSVSLIRIIMCTLLLLAAFTSIIALIYTSVRSAITAIGRNPLASAAIRKGLFQVALVVIAILAGALLASYGILVL